ncbi:tyrosine-type recombinase/integrase [Rhizobium sp. G21]|uniref:tyrosine-type recombinase/integrase n=1 Tax=Rhizobium sp. G21 TaxID=2758439 RepID=UPI0016025841|nr:site-specific integrase [Rhizobium sp. G21]MBB1249150.1 site-specific integrase [Rhizobium sp. G21]
MAGGQAKILSDADIRRLLKVATESRHPLRNSAIVQLSVRAGLRASEIALLDWSMVTDGRGNVANVITLPGVVTKYGLARRLPIHSELKRSLAKLRSRNMRKGPVIVSERGPVETQFDGLVSEPIAPLPMTPKSIVNWFTQACRKANLEGCSSHSGRRTFVTRAVRLISKAGGSLRDVQQLAGHRSIETTQAYIDGDHDIQRRLIRMM